MSECSRIAVQDRQPPQINFCCSPAHFSPSRVSITRTYMDDWLTMGPQQTFPIFSRQNILYWSFLAPRHRPDCLQCHLSWAIAREAFRAVPQKFWISPKTFGRYYSPPFLKHKHQAYTHQTSMTVMHSVPGIAFFTLISREEAN